MKYLIALFVIVMFSAAVPVVAGTVNSQETEKDGLSAVHAFLPSDTKEDVSFYIADK